MNGIPLAGTPRQVRCFYGLSVTANTYKPPGALLFATAYPFGHTTEPGLAAVTGLEARAVVALH
jgi:hypothetical protein